MDGKNESVENLDLDSKDPQKRAALLERLHFIIMGGIFSFFLKFLTEVPLNNLSHLSKISKKKENSNSLKDLLDFIKYIQNILPLHINKL